MQNMRKQSERFGTEIVEKEFVSGDFTNSGGPFKIKAGDSEYEGKSVIIATGADTKWLGVPGEMEKIGRGVSTCAPCDGPFFRNKNVIVVGGGDSAMEEAMVLTEYASEVTLVHRGNSFRASEIMQKRVKENPKIKIILDTEIKEILGDQVVEKVSLFNNKTNQSSEMAINGVFVAIGHIPNSKVFEGIDRDERGFIIAHDHFKTNVDGVFTAGDIHDSKYKQAITAAGYGAAAALEAEWWLRDKNSH
jgi:thioredoxin reductase (NADPH)